MRIAIGLLIAVSCFGQGKQNVTQTGLINASGAQWIPPSSTFASPPVSPMVGSVYQFTDALSVGACVGGGVSLSQCRWSGGGWQSYAASNSTCTPASGYSYCRQITINAVTGSLTGFPLATQNGSGPMVLGASRILNSNCYDVVFTSDAGGTTLIPWEVESCNQSTGAMVAWFPLNLTTSTSTAYVSYSNASITTAQNTGSLGPTHVYDSNYKSVQHLPNGSSLSVTDSTSTATSFTNSGATAGTGELDGGAQFNGTSAVITAASPVTTLPLTMEGWVNATSGTVILSNLNLTSPFDGWFVQVSGGNLGADAASAGTTFSGSSVPIGFSGWHHFAAVFTSNTSRVIYLDGVAGTVDITSVVPGSSPNGLTLGAARHNTTTDNYFAGSLDEIRISNIARSAAWIAAEYANQSPTSTLVSVGSEQPGSGGSAVTAVTASGGATSSGGTAPNIALDGTKVLFKYFGTAAPGTVSGNLPGDNFMDTTGHNAYYCGKPSGTAAPACTTVATGNWTLYGSGSGGGGFYQTVQANGTGQTQQPILNLKSGSNATVSCANNSGATSTDCTISGPSPSSGVIVCGSPTTVSYTALNTATASIEVPYQSSISGNTWYNGFLVSETTQFTGGSATGLTVSAGRPGSTTHAEMFPAFPLGVSGGDANFAYTLPAPPQATSTYSIVLNFAVATGNVNTFTAGAITVKSCNFPSQ